MPVAGNFLMIVKGLHERKLSAACTRVSYVLRPTISYMRRMCMCSTSPRASSPPSQSSESSVPGTSYTYYF